MEHEVALPCVVFSLSVFLMFLWCGSARDNRKIPKGRYAMFVSNLAQMDKQIKCLTDTFLPYF